MRAFGLLLMNCFCGRSSIRILSDAFSLQDIALSDRSCQSGSQVLPGCTFPPSAHMERREGCSAKLDMLALQGLCA